MNTNYCGKSCEGCTLQEELSCPGCRDLTGSPLHHDDCEITRCAAAKNHADCSTCTSFADCHLRLSCGNMPEQRKQRLAQAEEKRRWTAENAPEIGKWVWGIFVTLMVAQVVSLFNLNFIAEAFPFLASLSNICSPVFSFLVALYLLQLGKFKEGFRIAGLCSLGTTAASLVMQLISSNALTIVVGIPVIAVNLVSLWYECNAYADLLQGLDDELPDKWRSLFKWEIGTLLGLFGCVLLVLILSWVGLVALLADAIALIVVQILRYVYIYRTAKLFREYNK